MTIQSEQSKNPVLIVGSMAFDDLELPSGAAKNVVGARRRTPPFPRACTRPRACGGRGQRLPRRDAAHTRRTRRRRERRRACEGKTFRWAGRYSANLASRETLDTQPERLRGFPPQAAGDVPGLEIRAPRQHPPGAPARGARADEGAQARRRRHHELLDLRERKTLLDVLAKVDALVITTKSSGSCPRTTT